ncbi:hypothetical protein FJZ26_02985 [Candidatus Parvarchaeota archaeon]|nr:hypothetical protein [Candidatus Parvarchaeota archaeon]
MKFDDLGLATVLIVFLLAFAARLPFSERNYFSDESYWPQVADRFAQGTMQAGDFLHPPIPYVIYGGARALGLENLRLVPMLFGSLAAAWIFYMLRKEVSGKAAWLGFFALCASNYYIMQNTLVDTDGSIMSFFLVGVAYYFNELGKVWSLQQGQKHAVRHTAFSLPALGFVVFFALGVLTKIQFLGFGLPAIILAWLHSREFKDLRYVACIAGLLVAAAIFAWLAWFIFSSAMGVDTATSPIGRIFGLAGLAQRTPIYKLAWLARIAVRVGPAIPLIFAIAFLGRHKFGMVGSLALFAISNAAIFILSDLGDQARYFASVLPLLAAGIGQIGAGFDLRLGKKEALIIAALCACLMGLVVASGLSDLNPLPYPAVFAYCALAAWAVLKKLGTAKAFAFLYAAMVCYSLVFLAFGLNYDQLRSQAMWHAIEFAKNTGAFSFATVNEASLHYYLKEPGYKYTGDWTDKSRRLEKVDYVFDFRLAPTNLPSQIAALFQRFGADEFIANAGCTLQEKHEKNGVLLLGIYKCK